MHGFDFSQMMIILERVGHRLDVPKIIIGFFSVCLASIALRAMAMADTAIPRLLVSELVFALLIVLLFIFTKPGKPANPQHPLPSHEPLHLMRRINSRRTADEG